MTSISHTTKINNSYESEPSSSSSTDADGKSTVEISGDVILSLPKSLNLNGISGETPKKLCGTKSLMSTPLPHNPIILDANNFFSSQNIVSLKKKKSFELLTFSCSQPLSPGSEEISDQDVRFLTESKVVNLDHLHNVKKLDLSSCSIEPDSLEPLEPIDKPLLVHEFEFTLENSNNAVDNKLSGIPANLSIDIDEQLSFGGLIKRQNLNLNDLDNIQDQNEIFNNESNLKYLNEQSPDIFADELGDDGNDIAVKNEKMITMLSEDNIIHLEAETSFDRDHELCKRIQNSLNGVLPPPSITTLRFDIPTMLMKYYEFIDKSDIKDMSQMSGKECITSALPNCITQGAARKSWPDCLQAKGHGVYYNRSKYSEHLEMLCMRYIDRNIGAETSSSFSYLNSPSSSKKRNLRTKMLTQSPGNRLSHLARRRATFSSANLQNCLHIKQQLMIDTRKLDRRGRVKRTPKRYMPTKRRTPYKNTPTSAQKRLRRISEAMTKQLLAPTRESSKRALFPPSPELPKPEYKNVRQKIPPEVASRVDKSRRVLFSPPGKAGTKLMVVDEIGSKRKRDDDKNYSSDIAQYRPTKLQRFDTTNRLTPRSMLAKSQSFCVGSSGSSLPTQEIVDNLILFKSSSETTLGASQQLSHTHRQKLFWAVSSALQKKQIGSKHPKFKEYASVLAKVVKNIFLEGLELRLTSTSATLLRLAERLVYWVLQDKTVDDIYLAEKQRLQNTKTISQKLIGYIAPDEYEKRKELLRRSTSVLSTDSTWDTFNTSSQSSKSTSQSTEYLNQLTTDITVNEQKINQLLKSSSKSNAGGFALQENVDSEQRKSGQKSSVSFSGKDQKNVCAYSEKIVSNSKKLLTNNVTAMNIVKAKRQISFDS